MLKMIDALSLPGGAHNEDYYCHERNTVLLLDGASGLGAGVADPIQFVRRFSDLFMQADGDGLPLHQCVNDTLRQLQQQYPAQTEGIPPSASLLAIRVSDNTLHLLSVGDCTALLHRTDASVTKIHCDAVAKLDGAVRQRLAQLHQQTGQNVIDLVRSEPIMQMLRSNRAKMNQPNGYDIVAFGLRRLQEQDVQIFDLGTVRRIVLHTDGFDACQDDFYLDPIPALQQVYQRLRRQECADPLLNNIPRFKQSDDATALVLDIE